MKSVLISIQPYWVFLIIAKAMGWKIDKEKTIEVRKNFPRAEDWNKLVEIYCSKDKKSFNQIPKEYQPLMQKFLSKVVGRWVCNYIEEYKFNLIELTAYGSKDFTITQNSLKKTCLSKQDLINYGCGEYGNKETLYGWHICDLKIYDKSRELSEFYPIKPKRVEKWTDKDACAFCKYHRWEKTPFEETCLLDKPEPICEYTPPITRPPQSWCYVESLGE